jgi:hypothetical protein
MLVQRYRKINEHANKRANFIRKSYERQCRLLTAAMLSGGGST